MQKLIEIKLFVPGLENFMEKDANSRYHIYSATSLSLHFFQKKEMKYKNPKICGRITFAFPTKNLSLNILWPQTFVF